MAAVIFRCMSAAVLLLLTVAAAATDVRIPEGGAPVTLAEALSLTLERNPELVAYGYQIQAQQGRAEQARFGPAPQIDLLAENILGSAGFDEIDVRQTTLSISWFFERGKAEQRVDVSNAGIAMLEADGDVKRLDVAAETARRFLDCLAVQAQLEQIGLAVALSEQIVTAMDKRVTAGRSRSADLAVAQAQLARLQLDQEDYEHVLRVATRKLAAQWGANRPGFAQVTGDYEQLPEPATFDELVTRIDANPSVARYLNEQRLREAELRLSEAQSKSNWQLTFGVRRFDQTNDYAGVAGINVPLYSRKRNKSRSAVTRAQLAQVEADSEVARLQVQTELYAFYEELNHNLHRVEILRDEILPRMEVALSDAERAYAAGRYAFFELTLMQAETIEVRSELIEASIDAHRIAVEIERLTGVTLENGPVVVEGNP